MCSVRLPRVRRPTTGIIGNRRDHLVVADVGRPGYRSGMDHLLTSGPATVLASGITTTFFGHALALTVARPAGEVRLHLRFRSDTDVADVAIEMRTEPDGLHLDLINFDRPDGRGTADPVLLGEFGGELLFLHLRVFRYGRTRDHTVHHTLFSVPAEAVDWAADSEPTAEPRVDSAASGE